VWCWSSRHQLVLSRVFLSCVHVLATGGHTRAKPSAPTDNSSPIDSKNGNHVLDLIRLVFFHG
jgi:hypothetical protein